MVEAPTAAHVRAIAVFHHLVVDGLSLLALVPLIKAVGLHLDMVLWVEGLGLPIDQPDFSLGQRVRHRKLITQLLLQHLDQVETVFVTLVELDNFGLFVADDPIQPLMFKSLIFKLHKE